MAILKKKTKAAEATEEVVKAPVAEKPTKAKAPAKKAKKEEAVAPKKARAVSKLALTTILKPIATEKSAHLMDRGVYTFLVPVTANRVAVRQAIRELYKVTPVKVNIVNVRGTTRRFGRTVGRTSDMKKALVTLPQGSHIDVFASV